MQFLSSNSKCPLIYILPYDFERGPFHWSHKPMTNSHHQHDGHCKLAIRKKEKCIVQCAHSFYTWSF